MPTILPSNSGGSGELIENDISGIDLSNDNPQNVVETILDIIKNKGEHIEFSKKSKMRIRELVLGNGNLDYRQTYS